MLLSVDFRRTLVFTDTVKQCFGYIFRHFRAHKSFLVFVKNGGGVTCCAAENRNLVAKFKLYLVNPTVVVHLHSHNYRAPDYSVYFDGFGKLYCKPRSGIVDKAFVTASAYSVQ